jgi:hypothetical protein
MMAMEIFAKLGGGSRKLIKLSVLLLLTLCLLGALACPVFARAVSLQTNIVNIVPGAAATGGTALFKDGGTEIWSRSITSGQVSPAGAFTVANDTSAGTFSLVLTAPDSGVPGGTKNRTFTLSAPYTAMGEPVDFPVNTWLQNIQDSPPPLTGTATQTGFNLEMKPLISVDLAVTTAAPYVGNYARGYYPVSGYHYVVTDAGGRVAEEGNSSTLSFNLDPLNFPVAAINYILRSYAYNGYTTGHGGSFAPKWSGDIPFRTVAGAGGSAASAESIVLNLKKKAGGLGLNQFSFPGALITRETTTVATLADLVSQINAVGTARVTLLGWWDNTDQIDRGYIVTYSGATPSFAPVNGAPADPATVALEARKVYQVGVSENVTVEFKVTR